MNTRIFATNLFCVALACSTVPACAAMRVEIAGPLQQARLSDSRGDSVTAMKRLEVAEAVPNQTDEEKNAVARVKALVMHNSSKSADQSAFPRCGTGNCDEIRSDPPPPN